MASTMDQIQQIQSSLDRAIEAENECLKSRELLTGTLEGIASEYDADLYVSHVADKHDTRHRIQKLNESAATLVVAIFREEREVSMDVLRKRPGFDDIKDRALAGGDMIAFYKDLDRILPREQVEDLTNTNAANKLISSMRYGAWRWLNGGRGIAFNMWVSPGFHGGYDFNSIGYINQVVDNLFVFMRSRCLCWTSSRLFLRQLEDTIQSRKAFFIASDDSTGDTIELVTFKRKVEFRIKGELAKDFIAWIKKYGNADELEAA